MLRCGRSQTFVRLVQQQLLEAGRAKITGFTCAQNYHALRAAFGDCSRAGRTPIVKPKVQWNCGRGFAAGATQEAAKSRGPVSYLSLGITAATGAALLWYYNYLMTEKLHKAQVQETSVGKTMVGGPFNLTDHRGKPFTERDLEGRWSLLYFGFTFCPDICPDELEKLSEAVDSIEKDSGVAVQPVFITLDPERDSVPQVAEYIAEFHPRLVGLTGSIEEVNAAAKAYRVYHMKTEETEDYLVDHSIIMYLLDPAGQFVQYFGKNYDAAALSKGVQAQIADWKPEQPDKQQQQPRAQVAAS